MFLFFSCLCSVADVPSSPEITLVEPFSSTAVVKFEEPDSMGGVPIIKYRVEWRLPGQDWIGSEHNAKDGESNISPEQSSLVGCFLHPLGYQRHMYESVMSL